MGSQISGLSPPPLISIEDCLADLSRVQLEEELLGSRFFKVAKARRILDAGAQLVLIKIFPCPNVSELLSVYHPLVQAYCRQTAFGHNLLSFTITSSTTERAVLLVRDYIDQSLIDRLCTRPFLCIEEKKWIAFQLLHSLAQLHGSTVSSECSKPLCHGDVKAENVLLTSWGWVLLSDPAPFKPCWLPIDNPSEFTHYFDSSRRRVCYVAPERFVRSLTTPAAVYSSDNPDSHDDFQYDKTCFGKQESNEITSESFERYDITPDGDGQERNSSESVCDPEVRVLSSNAESKPVSTVFSKPDDSDTSVTKSSAEYCLIPAMDLFSLGCVLLELFTDGSVVFTLADLLAYRNKDSSRLDKLLSQIPCDHIRTLISSLLSLDGCSRGSAKDHLSFHNGRAFPTIFYSHLMVYMRTFLEPQLQNPTIRVAFIRQTLPAFLEDIQKVSPESLSVCAILLCNLVTSVLHPPGLTFITQTPRTMGLFANPDCDESSTLLDVTFGCSDEVTTPQFPRLSPCNGRLLECGKLDALICFLELSKHLSPSLLLDRIIPYCVDLTSPVNSSEVRILSLECLTQILQDAGWSACPTTGTPCFQDVSFFTEYLFPALTVLSVDSKEEVRLTYARCLPSLTGAAMRYA